MTVMPMMMTLVTMTTTMLVATERWWPAVANRRRFGRQLRRRDHGTTAAAVARPPTADPFNNSLPRVDRPPVPDPEATPDTDDQRTREPQHHNCAAQVNSSVGIRGSRHDVFVEVADEGHRSGDHVQNAEDPDSNRQRFAAAAGFGRAAGDVASPAKADEASRQEGGSGGEEHGKGRNDKQQAAWRAAADVAGARQLVDDNRPADDDGDRLDGGQRPGDDVEDPGVPLHLLPRPQHPVGEVPQQREQDPPHAAGRREVVDQQEDDGAAVGVLEGRVNEDASRTVERVNSGTGDRFAPRQQARDVSDTDDVVTERDGDDGALRIAKSAATKHSRCGVFCPNIISTAYTNQSINQSVKRFVHRCTVHTLSFNGHYSRMT